MEAKEFIATELELFVKRFTKTRVRYEYDQDSSVHFVEVVPNEVYHFDDEYIKWEDDVYERFIAMFPYQNICFVSDDDPIGVDYPELILEGVNFAPYTTGETQSKYDNVYIVNQMLDYDNITTNIAQPKFNIKFA